MRIVDQQSSDAPAAATFDDFYRAEHASAVRLAWLLTHDPVGCHDVVQDAFSAVFHRFEALERPAAYLRVAVVNRVREVHRRDEREQRRLRVVDGTSQTVTVEVRGDLTAAVARLPHNQRAALIMRYWADLPEADIAASLGVRPGTVRTLVRRALATLRQEVER